MLLGCAANAQRLHCPEQIGMERLDHQDHCRILQEYNAMGDVSSMTTKYCAPSNAAANWRREKAGPDMSMC